MILAAIMLKLGAYGFIRFAVPLYPDAAETFAPVIIVLSLIAIIYGAIVALVQPDLKRLVAYSSVSHMGFVTLGIFVFTEQGLQGAILQMINHGLITGALFLLVGVIYERTHDRTIAKMGGLSARTPVYAAVFGFFVFASAGLPGLSGFVGEFLVLVGTFEVNPYAAAIATFVMILAAGYLLYMYGRVVFGEVSDFLAGLGDHLTDMTPVEILTLVPLGALVVIFGLQPGLLLDLVPGTVTETLRAVQPSAPIAVPTTVVVGLLADPDRAHRGAHRLGRCVRPAARRPRTRERGRPLIWQDFVPISPLVAGILTAAAILIVDLIRPGRAAVAVAVTLIGLTVTAVLDLVVGTARRRHGVRRRLQGRCADDVPRRPVRRDHRADHRVRPRLPGPARPAGRRVRGDPRLRDDRGDAHRRVGRPAAAVPRPRADGPAGLPARRLPQDRRLLDRGRDQVFPARLVQLGDLPVRPRLRLGPDRHDPLDRDRRRLAAIVAGTAPLSPGLAMGLAFLTTGVAFKIAAVPFHYWTPDAYQGSPTPITGYLSVGPKVGAFALILRLFVEALGPLADWWMPVVIVLATLTMTLGNLVALTQDNVKRMLAYSSIAHTGYMLVGLAAWAGDPRADRRHRGPALLRRRLRVHEPRRFAVIAAPQKRTGVTSSLATFAGLGRREPLLGILMTLFLLSLIGIPPTAGFFAKANIILAAVEAGGPLTILAVITVLNAAVAAFYYLRVVVYMFMRESATDAPALRHGALLWAGLAAAPR